ncbi:amidophosphoribosyltransferase [Herminiimonas sp. KBW02]|uniref:phosphoribosyltransferase family protein n=1 Tax=Herminiimonas sp. KBW02 TaxID=2153363 RepID=UPI000F5AFBD1|nr:phosphoribosyltransferase family protein [Herminiimonas sp. KBW02]RQO34804.1 amidophosphoribosyltransferase [Herminiimonas sp. KBW02]
MLYRLIDWSRRLARRLPAGLPSSCALCGIAGAAALCAPCHTQFFSHRPPRCTQCAHPLTAGEQAPSLCGNCLRTPRAFDATIVASDYSAPIDHLVLALKFGNQLALAPLFARLIVDALLRERAFAMPTIMAAVPLGEQRLAERGFNQALEIAKPLSRAIAIPLAPQLILRSRETFMQSSLTPDARLHNMRDAFVLGPQAAELVRGQHIAIVDDVVTTGVTLNEIAALLKRYGAARVTNFVFARTPPR